MGPEGDRRSGPWANVTPESALSLSLSLSLPLSSLISESPPPFSHYTTLSLSLSLSLSLVSGTARIRKTTSCLARANGDFLGPRWPHLHIHLPCNSRSLAADSRRFVPPPPRHPRAPFPWHFHFYDPPALGFSRFSSLPASLPLEICPAYATRPCFINIYTSTRVLARAPPRGSQRHFLR
jgi:hypothetical protein